jgi:hypothetical protein
MKSVDQDTYYAAHRFGVIHRAGGRLVKRGPPALVGNVVDGGCVAVECKEFAIDGFGIVSRKVTRGDEIECWLRRDIADAAEDALKGEQAEHGRIIDAVGDFIRDTDMAGAVRNNPTVEDYRRDRHARGARWDKYRAKQRAGV